MRLDDDGPIRKVLPISDVQFSCSSGLLLGSVFHGKKKSQLVANMYLHLCYCFPGLWGGRNGWMGLDDVLS